MFCNCIGVQLGYYVQTQLDLFLLCQQPQTQVLYILFFSLNARVVF